MTREPTLAEIAAAGISLSLTPPFDFEHIPLPLDILDSLVEHYLPFASGWVEFDREEITGGSILYKMRQFQLGELGTIKLRKTGLQESAMQVSSSPSASSRNFTSEEKAAVKAREMQLMDILQQIQGERDDLNRRRKKHQADVIKGLFNRLAQDLTWQKHWGDLGQRTPTPAEDGAGEEKGPNGAKLASLRRQLAEEEKNLLLIDERLSKYVLETDRPLGLVKEKRRKQKHVEYLKQCIDDKLERFQQRAEENVPEATRETLSTFQSTAPERLPTPQQHSTHMRDATGPVHTGSGDIIYPTPPPPSSPFETELFLALDRWWESIKDYETSMGELGSASEANVLPQDNGMAIQLEHFRVSKIKAWPFSDEETRNAFDQAEGVFLGFIAKVYEGIYGHEAYGDQVPKEIIRNEKIAEIIGSHDPSRRHTFLECRQAYRKIRAQLGLGE